LKSIDLKGLEKINISIIKKAIENKVFKNGTIDGHMVAAIDSTKIFGSYKKCCLKCLTTEIKGNPHYYHCGAVMSVVGNGPKLVRDYEMYNCKVDSKKKDEVPPCQEHFLSWINELDNAGPKEMKDLICNKYCKIYKNRKKFPPVILAKMLFY